MFDTEYSYDMPSTSSHQLHSPFHAVHIHHHHPKSTKSADISRLLDPAYSSHSAYGPSSSQTRVYVDHHGDLHDPDYRHFPASSPSRRTRRVSDSYPVSSRPSWELGIDSEELEAYDDAYPSYPANAHTYTNRRSSSLTRPKASYMSSPFYPISLSSSFTPSPPTSFSDDETFFSESPDDMSFSSPFSDDKKCTPTSLLTKKFRRPSRKNTSATTTSARRTSLDSISSPLNEKSLPELETEEHVHPLDGGEDVEEDFYHRRSLDERPDTLEDEELEEDDSKSEHGVPTCTQAMKKQWQAVSLSVRFGVFRARRRMRRVLSR